MTITTIIDAIRRELSLWTLGDVVVLAAVTCPLWLPRALRLLGVI